MAIGILKNTINWALAAILAFGPVSVFLAVILEELLLPVPSAFVVVGAGFLLVPQGLSLIQFLERILFVIVIPASIANTLGAIITYGIGYHGGQPMIKKFHVVLRVTWNDIMEMKKEFGKGWRLWLSIAGLRAIPFFPVAMLSLTAGVLRIDWKKFMLAVFSSALVRNFVLAVAGWYLGSFYSSLAGNLNTVEDILFAILIGIILFMIYKNRSKVKSISDKLVREKS